MNVLAIDIGGTNVKVRASHSDEIRKFPSGSELTPQQMVEGVKNIVQGWDYECVTIGYPGPVIRGSILKEPVNLGNGWMGFNFEQAFGKPIRLINDAAMQALGSYDGGRMLFLGLGTGLGTAMVIDNVVAPLEMGHLPYKKGKSFEDFVGKAGMDQLGKKKWREVVEDVISRLKAAMVADYVVLGGGNAKKIKDLPPNTKLGENANAFIGGFRVWEEKFSHSFD